MGRPCAVRQRTFDTSFDSHVFPPFHFGDGSKIYNLIFLGPKVGLSNLYTPLTDTGTSSLLAGKVNVVASGCNKLTLFHSRQLSYVGASVTTTVEGVIPNGFAIENFPAEQVPHLGV